MCLIDIGIGRTGLAFQLDDNNGLMKQKDSIGPPRFKRKLVFQNGRVARSLLPYFADLLDFGLQTGESSRPKLAPVRSDAVTGNPAA